MTPPNPSPASPPGRPPLGAPVVATAELADALGVTRSTILRAIDRGELPEAPYRTQGLLRRWPVALAAELCRKAGRPIPKAWQPHAAAGTCACVRPAFCALCAAAEVGL